jgi:hypothetical protein
MAIGVGDEVAMKRVLTDETLASRGNVLFGLCDVVDAANRDILWENGKYTAAIPATALDKIAGVAAPQSVVTFTDALDGVDSPSYQGTIVRRYTRQAAGAGAEVSFTLVRLLSNPEELVEVLSSAIQVQAGQ